MEYVITRIADVCVRLRSEINTNSEQWMLYTQICNGDYHVVFPTCSVPWTLQLHMYMNANIVKKVHDSHGLGLWLAWTWFVAKH